MKWYRRSAVDPNDVEEKPLFQDPDGVPEMDQDERRKRMRNVLFPANPGQPEAGPEKPSGLSPRKKRQLMRWRRRPQ